MVDGIDDEGKAVRTHASPPCFVHELADGYVPDIDQDISQGQDFPRWRTAKRNRLIEGRLRVPTEERRSLSERIAAKLTSVVVDFKKPLAVGVGFARSRIVSIYPQPHNISMDIIVTEE